MYIPSHFSDSHRGIVSIFELHRRYKIPATQGGKIKCKNIALYIENSVGLRDRPVAAAKH